MYKSTQLSLLAKELAVKKKDEQINVNLRSVKHPHDCNTLVLQLQQVLHDIKGHHHHHNHRYHHHHNDALIH